MIVTFVLYALEASIPHVFYANLRNLDEMSK